MGPGGMAGHVAAEYGSPAATMMDADRVRLGDVVVDDLARAGARERDAGSSGGPVTDERYKTTRWRTQLSAATTDGITCGLAIRGLFGKSLVQSIVLEPLLAIAMAGRGRALVSAAGILVDGQAVLIAGASRSGKSTTALRAWATGHELLGDDHVIITADGQVTAFRRRLRLYPDLVDTAPLAVRRLGGAVRRRLAVARIVRRITGGFVGLPVLVDPGLVGITAERQATIRSLVVIERVGQDAPALGSPPALARIDDAATAWTLLDGILARDLAWVRQQGMDWELRAEQTRRRQLDILQAAIRTADAAVFVLRVPGALTASQAVSAIGVALDLDR